MRPLVRGRRHRLAVVVAIEHDRGVRRDPAGAHDQRRARAVALYLSLNALRVGGRQIRAQWVVDDVLDARARRDDEHTRRRGQLDVHGRPMDALLRQHRADARLDRGLHRVLEAVRHRGRAVRRREVGGEHVLVRGAASERRAEDVQRLPRQRLDLPAHEVEAVASERRAQRERQAP